MSIFADYARYYNLLYADKDYSGEVDFVLGELQKKGPLPETLLDLGCGTGRHAVEFARRGIAVTGVDLSADMIAMSEDVLAAHAFLEPMPQLGQGDALTVRLQKKFDVVVSLFHVMSYQTTEESLLAALETAKHHLRPGGLFFFDFWYGPGVLTDPPTSRQKRLEDSEISVMRTAEPNHRVADNVVEVHYTIEVKDKSSSEFRVIPEVHEMRYWFLPELRHLAKMGGFTVVAEGEWLSPSFLSAAPWNAWVILQA